jgi:hypothetical protein
VSPPLQSVGIPPCSFGGLVVFRHQDGASILCFDNATGLQRPLLPFAHVHTMYIELFSAEAVYSINMRCEQSGLIVCLHSHFACFEHQTPVYYRPRSPRAIPMSTATATSLSTCSHASSIDPAFAALHAPRLHLRYLCYFCDTLVLTKASGDDVEYFGPMDVGLLETNGIDRNATTPSTATCKTETTKQTCRNSPLGV